MSTLDLKPVEKLYIPIGAFGNVLEFRTQLDALTFAAAQLKAGWIVKLVETEDKGNKTFTVQWGS